MLSRLVWVSFFFKLIYFIKGFVVSNKVLFEHTNKVWHTS